MERYLIDNNVISNYFSGNFSKEAMILLAQIIDQTPNISVITEIEALSWISSDKDKEAILKDFIYESNIINLNSEIVSQTIKLRRARKMKTPDAIIAATAMINKLVLITSDSGFFKIQSLKVLNPLSL